MALNASVLSGLIRSKIMAKPLIQAIDNQALTDLCDAIAQAVVQHVTTAAVIPPGIPVATAGSPSAQTGATTGPGAIT